MPVASETAAGAAIDDGPDLVSFDLTQPPTEDEIGAFTLLLAHMRRHGLVGDGLAPPSKPAAPEPALESEADLSETFPRVFAMLAAFTGERSADNPPKLRITAAHDGFRRAGVAHDRQGRDYELDAFTGAELEAMLGDAKLTVELV